MKADFDRVIDRRHTGCIKYDFAVEHGYPADVLPLFIADMDFPAPECVQQALRKAVDHGIYGYSGLMPEYYEAVQGWFSQRFGWRIEAPWIVTTPGVVFALSAAVRAVTLPGDGVLIQPPVYGPFSKVVLDSGRKLVENKLQYENGRYTVDFDDFEEQARKVKVFLLCSPHNPVGRVWTTEELTRMGEICQKYQVTVVSDEIHCDFTLPGHPHTPFVKACPWWAEHTIVCTAPSKTFNLAGLQVSNCIVPGKALREAFSRQVYLTGYSELNCLGIAACQAAYTSGWEWLQACKAYLWKSLDYVRGFLRENLPNLHLVEPEGTYFAWLDCSGVGVSPEELERRLVEVGRLRLGGDFGSSLFRRVVLLARGQRWNRPWSGWCLRWDNRVL